MAKFQEIIDALIELEEDKLNSLVQSALDNGSPAKEILDEGLIPGMDIIGEKMETEEMFIPEVLKAAKIMSGIIETQLKPLLTDVDMEAKGKVVIGTVKGDLHDIGKNLVGMMMESVGFEVHNIGIDISPEAFVKAVQEHKANLLCLSALLTTTVPMMKETIGRIESDGLRDQVKIMIGGAPVSQKTAEEYGADGYAPDAGSAARMAKTFI